MFNCVGNIYGALSEIESDTNTGSAYADFQILELHCGWKIINYFSDLLRRTVKKVHVEDRRGRMFVR